MKKQSEYFKNCWKTGLVVLLHIGETERRQLVVTSHKTFILSFLLIPTNLSISFS